MHHLSELLDEATIGLADDPELRLDIRAELASHLDESIAEYAAEGHDEEDSVSLARKAFGSPMDIAGELLAANTQRIKRRALARLLVRSLLIPLAIVTVLVIAGMWIMRLGKLANVATLIYGMTPDVDRIPSFGGHTQASRKLAAILPGQEERFRQYPERLYALWQTQRDTPDGSALYAYYANNYKPEGAYADGDIEPTLHIQRQDLPQFIRVMQNGAQLDPDNALYHFRMAEAYLEHGVTGAWKTTYINNMTGATEGYFDGKVVDDRLMDAGIRALREGLEKPYLRHYHREMIARRLSLLPAPVYCEDYLARLLITGKEMYPERYRYLQLAYRIPICAERLYHTGRRADAFSLLEASRRLPALTMADASTYINIVSLRGMILQLADDTARVYRKLGEPGKAEAILQEMRQFVQPIKAMWAVRNTNMPHERRGTFVQSQLNAIELAGLYIPERDLAPTRNVEYVLLDEIVSGFLVFLLTLGMLWYAFHYFVQRKKTGSAGSSISLLLLPTSSASLRIVLLGIVVPIMIYLALNYCPPLPIRAYGLMWSSLIWMRIGILLISLTAAILYLPLFIMRAYVRRRCRQLGIPAPDIAPSKWKRRLGIALCICAVGFYTGFTILGMRSTYSLFSIEGAMLCTGLFGLLPLPFFAIAWLISAIRTPRPKADFSIYHATLSRSLIPIYAGAAILLGLLSQPALIMYETTLFRQDTLLFNGGKNGETTWETRITEQLKREMLTPSSRQSQQRIDHSAK